MKKLFNLKKVDKSKYQRTNDFNEIPVITANTTAVTKDATVIAAKDTMITEYKDLLNKFKAFEEYRAGDL